MYEKRIWRPLKIKDDSSGSFYKLMAGKAHISQNLCSEKDLNVVDF